MRLQQRQEFPIFEQDVEEARQLCLPVMERRYVIVHAGRQDESLQWPPQCFALLADYCIEKGYIVLLAGSAADNDINTEVLKCMRHTPIDLTGKASLGATAVLVRDAYMVVAGCTGVSRIATATQTPGIIINMDGQPERFGPFDKNLHKVIDWSREPHLDKVLLAANMLLDQQVEVLA